MIAKTLWTLNRAVLHERINVSYVSAGEVMNQVMEFQVESATHAATRTNAANRFALGTATCSTHKSFRKYTQLNPLLK
jgi:hypothetical protein